MHPFVVRKKQPDKAIYVNEYNIKICYLCQPLWWKRIKGVEKFWLLEKYAKT